MFTPTFYRMKKHIAISAFIILLSISTALPRHALADTGQTRSDIRPAGETTENTSAYDRITTAEIVLASMFAISSGRMHIYRRKNTAPDNRPDTATHTTVTSPADDTPPRRRHCRHGFRRERSHSHTLRADRSDRTAPQNNRLRTRPLRQSSENLRQPAGAHQRIAPHRRPRKRKLPPAQQPDRNYQQLFDTAFLCTYPRFVDRLNSLLLPEKTFPHPTPGQLTPELRVAAFMRIGVDDCKPR